MTTQSPDHAARIQAWLWDVGVAYERALAAPTALAREAEAAFMALLKPVHPGPNDDPASAFNAWVGRATGETRQDLYAGLPIVIASAAQNDRPTLLELFVPAARTVGLRADQCPGLTKYVERTLQNPAAMRQARTGLRFVIRWLVDTAPTALLRTHLQAWRYAPGWSPAMAWTALESARPNAVGMVLEVQSNELAEHLLALSPVHRQGVLENLFSHLPYPTVCTALARLDPRRHALLFKALFEAGHGMTLETPDRGFHDPDKPAVEIRFAGRRAAVQPMQAHRGEFSWRLEVGYAASTMRSPSEAAEAATASSARQRRSVHQVTKVWWAHAAAGAEGLKAASAPLDHEFDALALDLTAFSDLLTRGAAA